MSRRLCLILAVPLALLVAVAGSHWLIARLVEARFPWVVVGFIAGLGGMAPAWTLTRLGDRLLESAVAAALRSTAGREDAAGRARSMPEFDVQVPMPPGTAKTRSEDAHG